MRKAGVVARATTPASIWLDQFSLDQFSPSQ
jgi:hypothetical protein